MKLACTEIDRDRTPLGDLVLERYEAPGGEVGYQILIGGAFLMATHGHHSESALGPVARETRAARSRRTALPRRAAAVGLVRRLPALSRAGRRRLRPAHDRRHPPGG